MTYLQMRGITKTFPGGTLANDDVSLDVEAGEIYALLGENGAGKSTLMKILYGLEQPDRGEIRLDGKQVQIPDPQAAIRLGIGMVHQHFQLIPSLTVAENIALGYEPHNGIFVDFRARRDRVASLADTFGLNIDLNARIADLSVGIQQRVEILKLLYRQAKLLILDEPSAVLTPQEVEDLFIILKRLVKEGHTAIFITHKLYEVSRVCQRATVLRRGKVVGVVPVESTSAPELARMMVGHEVTSVRLTEPPAVTTPDRLVLRAVEAEDDRGLTVLRGVNLSVTGGEIFGIAGVEGNGQHELIEVLVGKRPARGDIIVNSQRVNPLTIRQRRTKGIAVIPEDRNREGLSKDMTIQENLVATRYFAPPQSRVGLLNLATIGKMSRQLLQRFDVRTGSDTAKVGSLSGGNAQKIVIARELYDQPNVLIAAQPTRGLDIGAAKFVHEQLLERRAAGTAILLISADLDELLSISDRIAVLYRGEILQTLPGNSATREKLGLLMSGKVPDGTQL